MRRFSRTWWITLVFSSAVVGTTALLLLLAFTSWPIPKIVLAAWLMVICGDVVVALSMEAIAPTRIDIGPGEKNLKTDAPAEHATVLSGFEDSLHGRVSVRGETWRAVRVEEDSGGLPIGVRA